MNDAESHLAVSQCDHRHIANKHCRRSLTTAVRLQAGTTTEKRFDDPSAAKRPKPMAYDASPVKKRQISKIPPYDSSVERGQKPSLTTAKRSKIPDNRKSFENAPHGHSGTTKARLFGHKTRCQCGQKSENLAPPIWPFLRPEKCA